MFEDFLKEQHAKNYIGTDDDMPDAFDDWLTELDVDTLINYADIAIKEAEIRTLKQAQELALKALSNIK